MLLQNKLTHSHKTSRKFRAEQYCPPSQGGEKNRSLASSIDRAQQKHASRNRPFSTVNTNFSSLQGAAPSVGWPDPPPPSLLCSREGRSSRRPGARSCQKGTAVKPAVPAGGAPSTAGRGRWGLSHRASRPRPSPRRDFYRYRWCRRSGRRHLHASTISHSRRSPRTADHQIPNKDPLRFILSPSRPDFPTHRVL